MVVRVGPELSDVHHSSQQATVLPPSSGSTVPQFTAYSQEVRTVSFVGAHRDSNASLSHDPAVLPPATIDLDAYLAQPSVTFSKALSTPDVPLLSQEELDRDLEDIQDFLRRISGSNVEESSALSSTIGSHTVEHILH